MYPKNEQLSEQQPKFKLPNCPSCKQNNCSEVDKGYYCRNCEKIFNKQEHQIDKTVLRQDRKIYKIKSNFHDNMNIRMDEDTFDKNAPGVTKIYHAVLLLMKFLQNKSQVKNMNIN